MNLMDLDEFADFKITEDFWFIHTKCPAYAEKIKVHPVPLKFLMVMATEHWMEYHQNDD